MDAHLVGVQEEVERVRYPHEGEDTDEYMLDAAAESEAEEEQSARSAGEDVLME